MIPGQSSIGLTIAQDQIRQEGVQLRRRALDVAGEALDGAVGLSEERTARAPQLLGLLVAGGILGIDGRQAGPFDNLPERAEQYEAGLAGHCGGWYVKGSGALDGMTAGTDDRLGGASQSVSQSVVTVCPVTTSRTVSCVLVPFCFCFFSGLGVRRGRPTIF